MRSGLLSLPALHRCRRRSCDFSGTVLSALLCGFHRIAAFGRERRQPRLHGGAPGRVLGLCRAVGPGVAKPGPPEKPATLGAMNRAQRLGLLWGDHAGSQKKRYLICFSRKDARGKAELCAHLAAAHGALITWSVDDVPPGASAEESFLDAATSADAVLILLSADLFAERDWHWQIEVLLQQRQARQIWLLPILWRACDWQAAGWLGTLKLLINETALATLGKAQRDREFAEIVRQLCRRNRPSGLMLCSRLPNIEPPSSGAIARFFRRLVAWLKVRLSD